MRTKYKQCVDYIKNNWKELTFFLPKAKGVYIGLPSPFVAPSTNDGVFENDQFYWDSYFIILGLIESDKINLAKGMVDNFAYLYKRFKIIPLRNKYYNLGISQPPFFTSMVLEIFNKTKDKKWLQEMTKIAESELENYWMNNERAHRAHKVYKDLSRYCDYWHTHLTSEHESGWDMTSRFYERCMDFLPIDLNSLLYKYEIDLSEIYKFIGDKIKSKDYLDKAKKRKEIINELMWNDEKGFFFDYDYQNKKQSNFYSLAGFYPIWSGLATKHQAKKMKENLSVFEYDGGLANTQKENLSTTFKQWDYPNGWPNQQWIVIKGLLNYGFKKDANRITHKWLELNKKVYEKTGTFWEKYNVLTLDIGKDGRYPTQKGFGWTNAIFIKLVSELNKNDSLTKPKGH
jgi:alpha,alpha-trehalase